MIKKVSIVLLMGFILTGCTYIGNEILTLKVYMENKDDSTNKNIGSDNDKTTTRRK